MTRCDSIFSELDQIWKYKTGIGHLLLVTAISTKEGERLSITLPCYPRGRLFNCCQANHRVVWV